MYSVKNIYPKFKCVTLFRKVMKEYKKYMAKWLNAFGLFYRLSIRIYRSSQLTAHIRKTGGNVCQDLDENFCVKWLWNEQNKWDKMAVFYEAMLARDKRVRTTSSLNDDVIGVIYSYL